jgi:hypothetical protein
VQIVLKLTCELVIIFRVHIIRIGVMVPVVVFHFHSKSASWLVGQRPGGMVQTSRVTERTFLQRLSDAMASSLEVAAGDVA